MMRSILLASTLVISGCFCGFAKADPIVYWAFNGDLSAPPIDSEFGYGTLTFGNLNVRGLKGLEGTTLNALHGFVAGDALSVDAGLGRLNNGKHFQFQTSLTGFKDVQVSWAQQGTHNGFNSRALAFSTNGTDFTEVGVNTGTLDSDWELASFDLSSFPDLNDAATAWFRVTISGATTDSGRNRFDNLTIQATAVPEPTSLLLVGLAAGGGLAVWGRKRGGNAARIRTAPPTVE